MLNVIYLHQSEHISPIQHNNASQKSLFLDAMLELCKEFTRIFSSFFTKPFVVSNFPLQAHN